MDLSVHKRMKNGELIITFITRITSTTPCGLAEWGPCEIEGGVQVMTANGRLAWEWEPFMSTRVCDPSILQELPMAITSPPWTITNPNSIRGTYTATNLPDLAISSTPVTLSIP